MHSAHAAYHIPLAQAWPKSGENDGSTRWWCLAIIRRWLSPSGITPVASRSTCLANAAKPQPQICLNAAKPRPQLKQDGEATNTDCCSHWAHFSCKLSSG